MTSTRLAFLLAAACCAAGIAYGQAPPPAVSPPPSPPPIPAESAPTIPPPAPPYVGTEPDLESPITIIRREDSVVEEVRVGGVLRYVKVTPRTGRPYFLVPDQNGNAFIRRDSLDIQLKVPLWVLFSF